MISLKVKVVKNFHRQFLVLSMITSPDDNHHQTCSNHEYLDGCQTRNRNKLSQSTWDIQYLLHVVRSCFCGGQCRFFFDLWYILHLLLIRYTYRYICGVLFAYRELFCFDQLSLLDYIVFLYCCLCFDFICPFGICWCSFISPRV